MGSLLDPRPILVCMNTKVKLLPFFLGAIIVSPIGAQMNDDISSGHLKFERKFYTGAVESYERGLANSSTDLKAQLQLASCYLFLNDHQKAENTYNLAARNPQIEAHPHHCLHYANTLKVNGKYAEATKWYQKLLDTKPQIAKQALESLHFAQAMKGKKGVYKVRSEKKVNTENAEYAPTLFRNKVAYASSKIRILPALQSDYSSNEDNYYYVCAPSSSGQLDAGKPFQKNTLQGLDRNIAPLSFNADGTMAASTCNSFKTGVRHTSSAIIRDLKISLHDVEANGQLKAGMPFSYNAPEGSTGFPALSKDGKILIFAQKTVTTNLFDLYISRNRNGLWSEPMPLGSPINTPGDEVTPFLSADYTLYFSSDGHKGLGNYDIYKADYNTQTQTWENVKHLGNSVNTPYDDLYFVYDDVNNRGYFSSNRKGGAGDYDIYSCELVGTEDQMPLVASSEGEKLSHNDSGSDKKDDKVPCGIDFYMGAIVDAVTKKPLEKVSIKVIPKRLDYKAHGIETSPFGEYYVKLERHTDYHIWLSKAGYKRRSFMVNTGNGEKRMILGTRAIVPVDAAVDEDGLDNVHPLGLSPNDETKPNKGMPKQLENDLTVAYQYTYPPKGKALPMTGYLVQVGKFKKLSDENRKKLIPYGHIFPDKQPSGIIYRVGIFADETHAQEAAKALDKEGFSGAYIKSIDIKNASAIDRMNNQNRVIYPKNEGIDPNANNNWADKRDTDSNTWDEGNFVKRSIDGDSPIINETVHSDWADNDGLRRDTMENSLAENTFQESKDGEDVNEEVEFKVQLGVYSKPEGASFPELGSIGNIQTQEGSNGLTYFYLASYATLDAAKIAKQLAEEKGVKNPFIVGFRNGKRVNLDDILK